MSTELVSIGQILEAQVITAAIVFAPGGVESLISKVEAEVRATPRDMATDEGRNAIKALAYKVARSKTALDDMGKELGAEHHKAWKAIAAERAVICDRLDALRDEVRSPLTAWEDAEKARVDAHEKALVWIIESPRSPAALTSDQIRQRAADVELVSERDWQEFDDRAGTATTEAIATLNEMLVAAIRREADAAELAELRRLKAEREEQDAKDAWQKAENDRMQKAAEERAAIEREHEERARNAKAAAEALATERATAFAAREIERAEQAKLDAEAAVVRAIEAERQRAAAQKATEEAAERKRQESTRHRNKIHKEIAGGFIKAGFDQTQADLLVSIISSGSVPRIEIKY